jgi:hypothetical protein
MDNPPIADRVCQKPVFMSDFVRVSSCDFVDRFVITTTRAIHEIT